MSLAVAGETRGRGDTGDTTTSPGSSAAAPSGRSCSSAASSSRLEGLSAAVEALVSVRVDELSDGEVEEELLVVDRARKRLDARVARLASASTHRRARRATEAHPGDRRAGERAARRAQRELADALCWSPQQMAGIRRDGGRMAQLPRASSAADRGELSTRHLRVLADVLDRLPNDRRDGFEAEMVELGKGLDVRAFGRACRRRLAEVDHDAAMTHLERQHTRRKAHVFQGEDGMVVVSGRWAGLDGEVVLTAVDAFRRPDRRGEVRTCAQRTADAVVDALRAALRGGDAPAVHGARPQVMVTVDAARLRDGTGVGEAAWSGPIPLGELRRVLDDCGLGWIVRDEGGLPLASGEKVRTVPAGLWRALVDRDRGCVAQGCDAPASWCDVMHLDEPHRDGGRLRLDNAALGCRTDHRTYDRGGLTLHWNGGRPILRRPPRAGGTSSSGNGGSGGGSSSGGGGPPAQTDQPRDGPDP
jgi:uncharacterized membrane protein YgcG